MVVYRKVTVGIFSRESEECYHWLINLLISATFRSAVRDVRPVTISSDACGHSDQLSREIAKCNFAILYHTKRRGRLNITDVTDSLYDSELQHLSQTLGRERVMVLVDDVDTDDSEIYNRILHEQPLIPRLSGLLVVISQDEKTRHGGGGPTSDNRSYQQVPATRSREKIRSQIRRARKLNMPFVLLVGFLVAVVIIIVIVVIIQSKK